jgi:hypothetical protein
MIHEEKLHSLRFSARVPARAIDLLISLAHYFMNKNRQVQQKVSCFPLLSAISIHPSTHQPQLKTYSPLETHSHHAPSGALRAGRHFSPTSKEATTPRNKTRLSVSCRLTENHRSKSSKRCPYCRDRYPALFVSSA